MKSKTTSCLTETPSIIHNLGTFEGFNFRTQCAISHILTAAQVVAWDHDRQGEAEFWPSGDRLEILRVFNRSSITASELLDLDRLLAELGGDCTENFLKIHYAVNIHGENLAELDADEVEDQNLHLFIGTSIIDLRRDAAYELFELYYPEEYRVWEKSLCDGLIFDTDLFLDSPGFFVEKLAMNEQKALIIAPQ